MDTKLAARWAGAFYFLIIAGAILTLIFVDSALIVAGDTAATVNNIRAKEFLYRIGVAADTIMFFQVVLLAVFLYIVLRTVNEDLAFLALLLRFAEGILGAAATLVGGVAPLLLLRYESSFDPGQLNALIQFFLDLETSGINFVLIFLGLGAIIYFYLFLKSKLIPSVLAIWGLITYFTMFFLGFVNILFPNIPETVATMLFTPGTIFELVIGLWLLIKGVKTEE
jgi:hypothetical protein